KPNYFEFRRRVALLAGKPMTVQVRRTGPDGVAQVTDIRVPPAYHYALGLRMRMGKVAAVRDHSPAQRAGLQPGDIIKQVRVAAGDRTLLDAGEKDLDPVRLPDQLAAVMAGA